MNQSGMLANGLVFGHDALNVASSTHKNWGAPHFLLFVIPEVLAARVPLPLDPKRYASRVYYWNGADS